MISALLDGVRSGNVRAVSRALSLVEDARGDEVAELMRELFPLAGRAFILGVTGASGAGKSTLIDRLVGLFRAAGKGVAVIAVDPSSPFTGGALLGDRIRMQNLAVDPGVFIRSMASRGRMGGLAPSVNDAVVVLDVAGYDWIVIETVGVGQDEVEIARTAHLTAVILTPGMGDDIQMIKAGIMEIADLFIVNKADRPEADRLVSHLELILAGTERSDGWVPPVVKTVATTGEGLAELESCINSYDSFLGTGLKREEKLVGLFKQRLLDLLQERLAAKILERLGDSLLSEWALQLARRESDPYTVVEHLMRSEQF